VAHRNDGQLSALCCNLAEAGNCRAIIRHKEGTDQILEDLGYIPTRYEGEITWRMPTLDETEN
jgi:GntR family transcriptional regulator